MNSSAIPIALSELDARTIFQALHQAVATGRFAHGQVRTLEVLKSELEEAVILPAESLSLQMVSLGAAVRYEDLESGQADSCQVVAPSDASQAAGRVSIFQPLGAALLGREEGQEVEFVSAAGPRRIRILSVSPLPAYRAG